MTLEIHQNQDLSALNTLRLGVRADQLVEAHSEADVVEALEYARETAQPVTILGGGSNVVFTGDVRGLVVLVAIPGILFDGESVEAGAGEGWHHLVGATLEHGLSGLENLSLIPGTVGAAPIQNIGAYGVELDSVFESLTAVDRLSGKTVRLDRAACEFGYRESVFKRAAKDRYVVTRVRLGLSHRFEPRLDYAPLRSALAGATEITPSLVSDTVCRLRRERLPDPDEIGNVGSFFKNPVVSKAALNALPNGVPCWPFGGNVKVSAGWLIEQCGLKGRRCGDAEVSTRHALVIVNRGRATADDVRELAALVQEEVRRRFDLELEVEPVFC